MTWARCAVVLAVFALVACAGPARPHPSPSSPGTVPVFLLNPVVTQATIGATICVAGWTATVRPPVAFTAALKRRQIAARRLVPTDPAAYEEDHLVPLELGGAPADERNLWPQPIAAARVKDRDENDLRAAVCLGRLTLYAAQVQIYGKWAGHAA